MPCIFLEKGNMASLFSMWWLKLDTLWSGTSCDGLLVYDVLRASLLVSELNDVITLNYNPVRKIRNPSSLYVITKWKTLLNCVPEWETCLQHSELCKYILQSGRERPTLLTPWSSQIYCWVQAFELHNDHCYTFRY